MMTWPVASAFFVVFAAFCQVMDAQSINFDVDKLVREINTDGGNNITAGEIQAYYRTVLGSFRTRCGFTEKIIPMYSNDQLLVSVLFDVMQSDNNASMLNEREFQEALLGQSNMENIDIFKETFQATLKKAHDTTLKPYQFTEGSAMFPVEEYQARDWANELDTNKDSFLSLEEISVGMKSLLDTNGNFLLERCEFVEAMRRYKQHPATAAKVYDVIFRARDLTWADVDSTNLAILISRTDTSAITRRDFEEFFTYQNNLASGVGVRFDGSRVDTSDNAGGTLSTFSALWLFSWMLIWLL
ncbi:hypothetical protein PoB_004164800 [Plakobranchus ocellatus]|uniref:EF-hand domain-containing protein n=1 Tax=Plakobranchus ocellatus TaxID=259542 RepID=A0AAV4B6A7_9GAST|nr:hypothetical protein PoB_004164800 [Plakobranchus ocellatus]